MPIRKIIHVDMDAFYASVEQRDNPELRGRPVAVGGQHRGVVAAASYEARAYGVHSAMPSRTAARKCPDLVFVKPRFDAYREASGQIHAVFARYTDLVEPLSLDEAFLDVTEPLSGPPSGTLIAREIKDAIRSETGLTASAGVSFNKFLAKLASDFDKPDGLTVITPAEAPAFIDALPIERFFGVGPVTAKRMRDAGIATGGDLKTWTEEDLVTRFGKAGRYYYHAARGDDDRAVRPDRIRKSLGAERTFDVDLSSMEDLVRRLETICDEVARRLAKRDLAGYTVTLKIKYHDFTLTSRQTTSADPVSGRADLLLLATRLLASDPPAKPIRLLGVTVSKLAGERVRQLRLPFEEYRHDG